MTDPNIVKFIDKHYDKCGDIDVKDIREYGEYTVSIPVYNASAEYAKKAVAVFHLNFIRNEDNIILGDVPTHLLTEEDCLLIKKTISDFLYEKELPLMSFREALLYRQQNPYEKQNTYFAWRKSDDTLFMIGMESPQINHILIHEYDTYFKDYNTKDYNINPHTEHMRGPQKFDPLEELVCKVKFFEYLGSWTDPDFFMESKDGRVAACGRWELAMAHICGEPGNRERLDEKIASAVAQAQQKELSNNKVMDMDIVH